MTTLINHWMKHPELKRTEELLIHLYRMRMATNENLAGAMGVSLKTIRNSWIPELYNQNKDFIQSRVLKDKKKVYYLGQAGCKVVGSILRKKVPYYDYTGLQGRHFEGINNILARLVGEIGIESFKYDTAWYFTRQARNLIQNEWGELLELEVQEGRATSDDAVKKINELPEPDARLETSIENYWLEFDNDTEGETQLKTKLLDYIETFIPMENHDPVIWIVTQRSPKQLEKLKRYWLEVQKSDEANMLREGYQDDFFFPEMHFFSEGEETKYLVSRMKTT